MISLAIIGAFLAGVASTVLLTIVARSEEP